MPQSKPFVVATEGPTIDGRNISKKWIADMAANYDPATYTAVVSLEHILSLSPDSLFSSYGKVVELATKEAEILGQKRLQLTAVVDAADEAVKMQKEGKKCFSSIEVRPNFLGAGRAYLTGLALTDTPASVGTESMRFSAFDAKKEDIYAFAGESCLEFPPPSANSGSGKSEEDESLLAKVKTLLKNHKTEELLKNHSFAIETLALSQKSLLEKLSAVEAAGKDGAEKLSAEATRLKTLADEFAALKTQLASTDMSGDKKPHAPGGKFAVQTDC